MENKQELKICQCGSEAEWEYPDGGGSFVQCVKCSIKSWDVECWNHRPIEDSLRAKITELEKERDGLKEMVGELGRGLAVSTYIDVKNSNSQSVIRTGNALIANINSKLREIGEYDPHWTPKGDDDGA